MIIPLIYEWIFISLDNLLVNLCLFILSRRVLGWNQEPNITSFASFASSTNSVDYTLLSSFKFLNNFLFFIRLEDHNLSSYATSKFGQLTRQYARAVMQLWVTQWQTICCVLVGWTSAVEISARVTPVVLSSTIKWLSVSAPGACNVPWPSTLVSTPVSPVSLLGFKLMLEE